MKKTLSTALAALGLAFAAPSSAIVVGGIDFGNLGNTMHIETATLAETLVRGVGDTLEGYGYITTVNGDSTYCAVANCSLYYYFSGYTVSAFNGTQVQFTGGTVDIYYDPAANINLLNQDSVANVAAITAMTPWARLTGHTFFDPLFALPALQTLNGEGSLTGATLSQTGRGQLDVDTGGFGDAAVAAYLDGNSIADNLAGFADVVLTSSSNNFVLNPFDVANGLARGCDTGQAATGAWCLQGTLNTRGATVIPEPGTLALLALGVLGFGFGARGRRNS